MASKQVVQFEFLRTQAHADALTSSAVWQSQDSEGRNSSDRLRQATYLDFLYIISYSGLFIFLAYTVLGHRQPLVKTLTRVVLLAGLCDLAENICLLQILNGGRGWYPAVMFYFASLKFGLLAVFVVWLLIVAGLRVRKKMKIK